MAQHTQFTHTAIPGRYGIEILGSVSTPFGTLAICPGKILWRSSQGNPSVGGVKHERVAKYSDFGPIECYILQTVRERS